MAQARITIATEYADPDANADFASDFPDEPAPAPVMVRPHPYVMNLDMDSLSSNVAVVADTTASDEEVPIDFGDVAEATGFVVRNRSGQDLSVAVNGVLAGTEDAGTTSAAATLSTAIGALAGTVATLKTKATDEHTAAAALDALLTTHLGLLNAFDDMDAAADIVAAIATANVAISAAQASLALADGEAVTANAAVSTAATTTANTALGTALDADGTAVFTLPDGGVLACAVPPNATTPIESLSLYTTATQSGDGEIDFSVFGSAAP